MGGAIPLLPLYMFKAWTGAALLLLTLLLLILFQFVLSVKTALQRAVSLYRTGFSPNPSALAHNAPILSLG
jgi:hypothetical protein